MMLPLQILLCRFCCTNRKKHKNTIKEVVDAVLTRTYPMVIHNCFIRTYLQPQTRRPNGEKWISKVSVRPIWLHESEDRPNLSSACRMSENDVTDRERMGQSDKIRQHQAALIRWD